uniref:Uncharacterized protein n=1 Tax=Gouania willdenowi TaxID=441366 RepID=A0A8C5EL31_GOUWI
MFNKLRILGSQLLGLCLLQFTDASCGFGAHDSTSPVTANLKKRKKIRVGLDSFHKLGESHLDGIHIVGDDDQLGLLALNQRGDSVHT